MSSPCPLGRPWRTRKDPFEADWARMEQMLKEAPELEAKALFEHLLEQRPGQYGLDQLRTFQRRVKAWRAKSGPEKEIFFPQAHRAGEAAQTDFTWATELGITILGELFEHMLCVTVLPFSLWQWATPCLSESMAALREGVQNAFFTLGFLPRFHQTDNSTAATHDLATGKRGFNAEYEALMRHLSLQPRTTEVGAKEQNGSVESTNGALSDRHDGNAVMFGDDHGCVFPSYNIKRHVTHVRQAKEQRYAPKKKGKKRRKVGYLPSPHRLRDTFVAACVESGVGMVGIKALVNHSLPSNPDDVTEEYYRPSVEHLRRAVV